jgi:hypothetical protein
MAVSWSSRNAERRVLLFLAGCEGQWLVGAGIERPDDDLPIAERREDLCVGLGLICDGRGGLGVQEQHLGAEQANTLDVFLGGTFCVLDRTDVGEQLDRVTVLGPALAAGRSLQRGPRLRPGDDRGAHVLVRIEGDGAGGGVDGDGGVIGELECSGHPDQTRQVQLRGDDRGVAGRTTEFGDDADDMVQVEGRGIGRCEVGGNNHCWLAQRGDAGFGNPQYLRDDPVPDVPQIGDPLGQVGPAGLEDLAEALNGLIDSGGRTGAGLDPANHIREQARVLRHQRGGLEHRSGGGLGCRRPDPQIVRDVLERAAHQCFRS